jgi:hypothetical protein
MILTVGQLMMNTKLCVLLIATLWGVSGTVNAHHSFAAVFDVNSPIELSGTVTKVEWMNPHAWVYLDIEDEDGNASNWAFELGSPNGLMRRGWTRKSIQIGHKIRITGYRARDGSRRGNVKSVVLDNGTELTGMSSRPKTN